MNSEADGQVTDCDHRDLDSEADGQVTDCVTTGTWIVKQMDR